MKLTTLLTLGFCLSMTAQAQQFTVSGNIPGLKNQSAIEVKNEEGNKTFAKATSQGSKFTVKGKIDKPTLVNVTITLPLPKGAKDDDMPVSKSFSLYLENTGYVVEAAHIDSIPNAYDFHSTPLYKEKNVTVKSNSTMQQHYQEWRNVMWEPELNLWKAQFALRDATYGITKKNKEKADEATVERLTAQSKQAYKQYSDVLQKFLADHPNYAISLYIGMQPLSEPFSMTPSEMDDLLKRYSDNEDKARVADLKAAIEKKRAHAKGAKYVDFDLLTPEKETRKFSQLLSTTTYNFVDAWASWCGPCRMAIPHVKKLHQTYGDRLNILSVSVDRNEAAWREAMQEENMPWTQTIAPESANKLFDEFYEMVSIPYLMVISPEGKIELVTHSPDEVDAYLQKVLK